MKTETIVMCVVALLLGMLLANMLKNVCGCKTVEGQIQTPPETVIVLSPDNESPPAQEQGFTHQDIQGPPPRPVFNQQTIVDNVNPSIVANHTIPETVTIALPPPAPRGQN